MAVLGSSIMIPANSCVCVWVCVCVCVCACMCAFDASIAIME